MILRLATVRVKFTTRKNVNILKFPALVNHTNNKKFKLKVCFDFQLVNFDKATKKSIP